MIGVYSTINRGKRCFKSLIVRKLMHTKRRYALVVSYFDGRSSLATFVGKNSSVTFQKSLALPPLSGHFDIFRLTLEARLMSTEFFQKKQWPPPRHIWTFSGRWTLIWNDPEDIDVLTSFIHQKHRGVLLIYMKVLFIWCRGFFSYYLYRPKAILLVFHGV